MRICEKKYIYYTYVIRPLAKILNFRMIYLVISWERICSKVSCIRYLSLQTNPQTAHMCLSTFHIASISYSSRQRLHLSRDSLSRHSRVSISGHSGRAWRREQSECSHNGRGISINDAKCRGGRGKHACTRAPASIAEGPRLPSEWRGEHRRNHRSGAN